MHRKTGDGGAVGRCSIPDSMDSSYMGQNLLLRAHENEVLNGRQRGGLILRGDEVAVDDYVNGVVFAAWNKTADVNNLFSCMCICTYICVHACMRVCVCVCVRVRVCLNVRVCMPACMCVHGVYMCVLY